VRTRLHSYASSASWALGLLLFGGVADARADDKAVCVDAHASGQELRLGGHWTKAAAKFRACSAATCPQPVTVDCTRWYEELRAAIPSIVVAVSKPDGTDTAAVRLSIDGAPIGDRLPATSIDVDPGEHTLRVEAAPWLPVEKRIIVREREKDRRVSLAFAPLGSELPKKQESGSTFGWVMVGVGAAAAITAGTFGILGKVREDQLAGQPCGKNGTCSHADVDVVRHRYLIAGIAGGVGVVGLAVGLYYLLGRRAEAPPSGRQVGFRGLGSP
jgi:hypothetical protein